MKNSQLPSISLRLFDFTDIIQRLLETSVHDYG